MTDRELFEKALKGLEAAYEGQIWLSHLPDLITALRERLAQTERHELQAKGEHPAPCARHCEATAFQIVIKNLKAQLAQPEQEPVAWCPDVCPITGLLFFMWIDHHETGQKVPTYGGPYDSYTIPVRDKDGSYYRERYDHDLGGWLTDEVEGVGVQIVSDQAYVSDEPPASKPWVGLTDEEMVDLQDRCGISIHQSDFEAIEAKLKEKNT